jgi:hypothetical protein
MPVNPAASDFSSRTPSAAVLHSMPTQKITADVTPRPGAGVDLGLAAPLPPSARPRGRHGGPEMDEPPDVRWIVLHMIEETARHAGHLDIARELIDGQTGLGPR